MIDVHLMGLLFSYTPRLPADFCSVGAVPLLLDCLCVVSSHCSEWLSLAQLHLRSAAELRLRGRNAQLKRTCCRPFNMALKGPFMDSTVGCNKMFNPNATRMFIVIEIII